MSDPRARALASVASVIRQLEDLGDPGAAWSEDNGGWTTEARTTWLRVFAGIRDQLLAEGTDFDRMARHLVRELDHWSVVGGPILEEAAQLQRHLRRLLEGEGLAPVASMIVTFERKDSLDGEPVGRMYIHDENAPEAEASPAHPHEHARPQEAWIRLSEARAWAAALGYKFREN
jgi:hypothetical protein